MQGLVKSVEACKVTEELRFNVGDPVWARPDPAADWSVGTVWKQWDDGQPYVIELEDGDKVYCPLDTEEMIKKREAEQGAPATKKPKLG